MKGKLKFSFSNLSNLSLPVKAGFGMLGTVIVLVVGLSIYKQHQSPKVVTAHHVRRTASETASTPKKRSVPAVSARRTERGVAVKQPIPKEKTTATEVAKTSDADLTVDEVLKQVAILERKLYLLKEENKFLQEKIKNLEAKEKLNQLKSQEPITIEPPREVEALKLQIENLRKQLVEMRKKKVSTKKAESIKEALNKMILRLKQPQVPRERYQLIAIVNGKAVLKDSRGNRIEVKDGDKLGGRVVKVNETTVKIGNEVLSIFDSLSQSSSAFLSSFSLPKR